MLMLRSSTVREPGTLVGRILFACCFGILYHVRWLVNEYLPIVQVINPKSSRLITKEPTDDRSFGSKLAVP